MQSTPNSKPTDDPHDCVAVSPDLVRVAVVERELLQLAQDAARRASVTPTKARSDFTAAAPVPSVDATFRPTAVNGTSSSRRRRPIGTLAARTFTALLLAGCTGLAAMTWQSYGDAAKAMIAEWTPQSVLSSLPMEKLGLPTQAIPPSVETAASEAAPAQAATPVSAASESAATQSSDSTQLLQSMARDLANVSQEVVQLKASIEQLKANQQQISRDAAKPPAQNAQARIIALPPRLPVARPRQPAPTFAPAPAAATPPPPAPSLPPVVAQPQIAPDGSSVPRPPMPVR